MPRGIKKTGKSGLDTDFTITDAAKRAEIRRKQLEAVAGIPESNPVDDLNVELEDSEPGWIKNLFE